MAISKMQPMRTAEIELVDKVNALEVASNQHAQNISTLTEGLADEISAREINDVALGTRITAESENRISSDNTLGNRINAEIQARADAVGDIQTQLGSGFTQGTSVTQSLSATNQQVLLLGNEVNALSAFAGKIGIGLSGELNVPANDSLSTSITFPTPFAANASCGVFPCVVTGELSTLFEITIIDCTYSGFSFSVSNSDADAHTIRIGYLAVNFS